MDVAEGGEAGLRHHGDAALARVERSLLVRLPDPRGAALHAGRSGQADQGAAVRSREDGGALTSITRIPYDAQHLPFTTVRFVKNDTAFEFDVQVPANASVARRRRRAARPSRAPRQQQPAGRRPQQGSSSAPAGRGAARPAAPRNETLRFEYDLATARVGWSSTTTTSRGRRAGSSLSPDGQTVVFARNHNLFMMDADNYAKALKKADDPTIVEVQLTTDGVEHYSYGAIGSARSSSSASRSSSSNSRSARRRASSSSRTRSAIRPTRTRACRRFTLVWSRDSNKFAVIRRDARKVQDLWVINALAQPRPTLESYRYAMPGEKNIPQSELLVFDRTSTAARRRSRTTASPIRPLSIATRAAARPTSSAIRAARFRRSG